jgi:hypothetical protein
MAEAIGLLEQSYEDTSSYEDISSGYESTNYNNPSYDNSTILSYKESQGAMPSRNGSIYDEVYIDSENESEYTDSEWEYSDGEEILNIEEGENWGLPAPPSQEELEELEKVSRAVALDRDSELEEIIAMQAGELGEQAGDQVEEGNVTETSQELLGSSRLSETSVPDEQEAVFEEAGISEELVVAEKSVKTANLDEVPSQELASGQEPIRASEEAQEKYSETALTSETAPENNISNISHAGIVDINDEDDDENDMKKRIHHTGESIKATQTMVMSVIDVAHKSIKDRLRLPDSYVTVAAVASGDVDDADEESATAIETGLWSSVTYAASKQSSRRNIVAYKGQAAAITVGMDTELNGSDVVGVAYSNVRSNFKYAQNYDQNNDKVHNNKVHIHGHILSIYSQNELGKDFSLQAIAAISRNYVKNKINYLGNRYLDNQITGKYCNTHVSIESLLNYRYRMKNGIHLIPNIGIRYGKARDGVYREHDIGLHHLSVGAKSQQLLSGIIGGKVIFAPQRITELINIIPALHGAIEKPLKAKNKRAEAKIMWQDQVLKTDTVIMQKQSETSYNIGASILARRKNLELQLEYNCNYQKKYRSHQGLIKLKINL